VTEQGLATVFRWRVLADQAVATSAEDAFGVHAAFGQLLYELAQNCTTPFAVGLYSGWGTGKTSVARMLEERISGTEPRSLGYVYLDVWKYASDPLKRWILLETERQLKEQGGLSEKYTFKGRSLESHLEFEEQWTEKGEPLLGAVLSPRAQTLLWILTLVGWPATGLLFYFADQIPRILRLLAPLLGAIAGAGVLGLLLRPVVEVFFQYLKKISFRQMTWNVKAKPAFSSEKFAAIFRDMVRTACEQLPGHRIVFVFDNLDRCPESVAVETIAVVKTYLDERGCVYVIPCDQDAIVTHVAHSYIGDRTHAREYAKEFLNKFFQMTLRLPTPVDFDLEAFIDKEIKAAGMEDLPLAARDVLVLGYRGETPRQVKRILNDLVGYSALATAAEKNKLLETGDLTADLAFLTKMSVISANWPEFLEKVANDPEMWPAAVSGLQARSSISALVGEPALEEFLKRTKHVSPDADIRPYLFLKRVSFERDAPLRIQVERALRNGDEKQYRKLLESPENTSKFQDILVMTVNVVRKWRTSGRGPLVMNAAPLVVWAAARRAEDWNLTREALDVLEQVCTTVPGPSLEPLFDVDDVLVLVKMAEPARRRTVLAPYVQLFGFEGTLTDRRRGLFKALLVHDELLDAGTKATLVDNLIRADSFVANESDQLELLVLAGENVARNSWVATPARLAPVAARFQWSGDDLDRKRMLVLSRFQGQLSPETKVAIVSGMAGLASSAVAGTNKPPKPAISILGEVLRQFDIGSLGDISPLGLNLLTQMEAHAIAVRAPWASLLLGVLPALSPELKARFGQAIKTSYLEVGNPAGVQTFLQELGDGGLRALLGVPGFSDVVKSEAQLLERQHGLPAASSYREQHLSCFPPVELACDLSLYDDSKAWDVVIYINNVKRALSAEVPEPTLIIANLTKVAEKFPSDDPKVNRPVFDAVCALTDSHPDVVSSGLAKAVAARTVDYLASGADEDYRVFRKCLGRLSPQDRTSAIRQLENRCFRDAAGDRTKLLAGVTEDVCSDPEVRGNRGLVKELFDFAYSAASEYPDAALDSLLRLSEYLADEDRASYLDRALDRLVYLEAGDSKVEQMEPFLRLLLKLKQYVSGSLEEKLGRFLKRMLSPASERQRKLRALDLLIGLQLAPVAATLSPELQDIVQSEDPDLSAKASQITAHS